MKQVVLGVKLNKLPTLKLIYFVQVKNKFNIRRLKLSIYIITMLLDPITFHFLFEGKVYRKILIWCQNYRLILEMLPFDFFFFFFFSHRLNPTKIFMYRVRLFNNGLLPVAFLCEFLKRCQNFSTPVHRNPTNHSSHFFFCIV